MGNCGTPGRSVQLEEETSTSLAWINDSTETISVNDQDNANVVILNPSDIDSMPIIMVNEPAVEYSVDSLTYDANASGGINDPYRSELNEIASDANLQSMTTMPSQMKNEISLMLEELLADEAIDAALLTFDPNTIDLGPLDDIPDDIINEFL